MGQQSAHILEKKEPPLIARPSLLVHTATHRMQTRCALRLQRVRFVIHSKHFPQQVCATVCQASLPPSLTYSLQQAGRVVVTLLTMLQKQFMRVLTATGTHH